MNTADWRSSEDYRNQKQAAEKAYKEQAQAIDQCCAGATCEQTVGEHLDAQISRYLRVADALRDLKASLPGSFLGSGASRIAALTLPR